MSEIVQKSFGIVQVMTALLHRHESMTENTRGNIVLVQVAYRSLKRHFAGELRQLEDLTPSVLNWLENHGYIELVIMEEGDLRYQTTDKADRSMMVSSAA